MATQTETQTETSQVVPTNGVPQSKTALKIVFGAMTLGKEGVYSTATPSPLVNPPTN